MASFLAICAQETNMNEINCYVQGEKRPWERSLVLSIGRDRILEKVLRDSEIQKRRTMEGMRDVWGNKILANAPGMDYFLYKHFRYESTNGSISILMASVVFGKHRMTFLFSHWFLDGIISRQNFREKVHEHPFPGTPPLSLRTLFPTLWEPLAKTNVSKNQMFKLNSRTIVGNISNLALNLKELGHAILGNFV